MVHMDWGHLPLVLIKKENQDAVQQRTSEISKYEAACVRRLSKNISKLSVWKMEAKRGHDQGLYNFSYNGHQN